MEKIDFIFFFFCARKRKKIINDVKIWNRKIFIDAIGDTFFFKGGKEGYV